VLFVLKQNFIYQTWPPTSFILHFLKKKEQLKAPLKCPLRTSFTGHSLILSLTTISVLPFTRPPRNLIIPFLLLLSPFELGLQLGPKHTGTIRLDPDLLMPRKPVFLGFFFFFEPPSIFLKCKINLNKFKSKDGLCE
jgi:hypothetical protein